MTLDTDGCVGAERLPFQASLLFDVANDDGVLAAGITECADELVMAKLESKVKVGDPLGTLELFHITWQSTFRGRVDDMYVATGYELVSEKALVANTRWSDLRVEAIEADFADSERYANFDVVDKYRVQALIQAQLA